VAKIGLSVIGAVTSTGVAVAVQVAEIVEGEPSMEEV
jgi:hypothetical protein